jgi:ComF family protein
MWRATANACLATLFEPACAACARPLIEPLSGAVCAACWADVRAAAVPISERLEGAAAIDTCLSLGEYEGRLREIIHALKYDSRRSIVPVLGAMMRHVGDALLLDASGVVPVPLHARRQRARGFNQAADLAMTLGPPVMHWLRRRVATPPQVDLAAHDRFLNVRDAFALSRDPWLLSRHVWTPQPRGRLPLDDQLIVLVDDVTTTGATLEACARVLKAAGAKEVRAITAARVASARR